MEKSYIERVTNLERATVEYVPKKWFNEMEDRYRSQLEFNEWEEKDINGILADIHESVAKDTVKLYQLDVADRKYVSIKPPLNVCPYCGEKMKLSWADSTLRIDMGNRVAYKCFVCGALSPSVFATLRMLNEDIVAKEIWNSIESSIIETNNNNEEGGGGDQ